MVENFALGNIVWYTHVPIQGAHRQNANIPPMGCLQGGRILLQGVFACEFSKEINVWDERW